MLSSRPGNEMLIPITAGSGMRAHTTLYVVRRAVGNTFALTHFDSAIGNFQRTQRVATGRDIRGYLASSQWARGTDATISDAAPINGNDTRQHSNWECGVHVVLYGWAYALGLTLATAPLQRGARYTQFLTDAVEIINLALQGLMSSNVIKNFMECHGFILPGQEVPRGRKFARTVRVEAQDKYITLMMLNSST